MVVAIVVHIVVGTDSIVDDHIGFDSDIVVVAIEVVVKHSSVQVERHFVDAVGTVGTVCSLTDIAGFALVDRS